LERRLHNPRVLTFSGSGSLPSMARSAGAHTQVRAKDSANCIVRLHLPESFTCIHPGCTTCSPTADSLDRHIRAHFAKAEKKLARLLPYHPFDSLAALHAAASKSNPPLTLSSASAGTPTSVQTPTNSIMSQTQSPISTNSSVQSEGGRPTCQICNQSFSRFADLERHAKKHQPGRDYTT